MATPRDHALAGIHLDGTTATVVTLAHAQTHPTLATIHQVTGFNARDTLVAAARHLPERATVRVATAAPGVAAVRLDVTPAALTRAGFTAAAFRAFGDLHPTTAIAGVIDDPDAVRGGALRPGLAVAAPADLVTDIYDALRTHPGLEVTTCAVAAAALDGVHLALRRATSEVTLVVGGRTRASVLLHAGGLDTVQTRLHADLDRVVGTLAGGSGDPIATSVLTEWVTRVATETRHVLHEWTIAGLPVPAELYAHGRAAGAAVLDEQLAAVGLTRLAHPYAGLPHTAPLDTVEAYLAAVSCGRDLPHASFLDPGAATAPSSGPSRRTVTLTIAGALTMAAATLGPVGYAEHTLRRAHDAHRTTVTSATPAEREAVAAHMRGDVLDRLGGTGVELAAPATRAGLTGLTVTRTDTGVTLTGQGPRPARQAWADAVTSPISDDEGTLTVDHGRTQTTVRITTGATP